LGSFAGIHKEKVLRSGVVAFQHTEHRAGVFADRCLDA
jgi:hypothetical protein